MFEFIPVGVCPKKINFCIQNGHIKDVIFTNGCDGNLKVLSQLIEGMPVEEVVKRFEGVQCKTRGTSCADQLAKAIKEKLNF